MSGKTAVGPGPGRAGMLLAALLLGASVRARAQVDFDSRSGTAGVGHPSAASGLPPLAVAGRAPAAAPALRAELLQEKDAALAKALELIAGAGTSIRFETFDISGEKYGWPVARALLAKAREGVRVQVLLDTVSQTRSGPLKDIFNPGNRNNEIPDFLRRQFAELNRGADPQRPRLEVLDYNDKVEANQSQENPFAKAADHAKALVVDSRRVLAGGTNFDDDPTHDLNVAIDDPGVAGCVEELFNEQWLLAGGRLLPAGGPCSARGPVRVLAVGGGRQEVKPVILDHFQTARRIDIEMYVFGDLDLVEGLRRAKARGAQVRMILNHGDCDHDPTNGDMARLLHAAGVEVREYERIPGGYMHTKLGLFDGKTMMLGSTNWVHGELTYIHDYEFEIADPALAARAAAVFEDDWKNHSRPYDFLRFP